MFRTRSFLLMLGFLVAVVAPFLPNANSVAQEGGSDILIRLPLDFIHEHKLKATVTMQATIDQVGKVHSPSDDGDMHFSVRSDEVKLPVVAEIMNAGLTKQKVAVKAVKDANASGAKTKLTGAWRMWCEHGGIGQQTWKSIPTPFPNSNPNHIFELHPVTAVGDMDLTGSVGPIVGYTYKNPHNAFIHYENLSCTITPPNMNTADKLVTLRVTGAQFNMPEFLLEPLEDPTDHKVVEDGRFLMAAVHDLDGEVLVAKLRMVFIKDTAAEKKIRNAPKGSRLHVVGIPRINMSLIEFRLKNADKKDENGDFIYPDLLRWHLPYEIIVVGVLSSTED